MADGTSVSKYEDKKVDDPLDDYVPEGFESQEAFLEHVRKEYKADELFDADNRAAAMEDLKFVAGDQWDDVVAQDRKAKGRPCLTINVLPQFIGQVIGDRRLNKTTIKVRPLKDATMKDAEIRSGIIKGIEHASRAERVYDAACEDQVTCGISNFRIDLEYSGNDVFDQDIIIRHIPNPLAVIWDRMSIDPTGRDARHCFVQDSIPRDVYDRRFGDKHPCPTPLGNDSASKMVSEGWFGHDRVRITEYWDMVEKPATFALMHDGDVKDITGMQPEEYEEFLWRDPRTGAPRIRKSFRTYARMHLVTGFAILSEPYELPLTRLPIIRVEGRVVRVGEDRIRYGLVRFAKDSQRLKNYWRSVAAERLAMAPKAHWTAAADSVEGREDQWRQAHQSGDPLLIYNKNTEAPQRVDPPDVPVALIQEAQLNQQDIKDVTGLHDASLGIRSNEVSGKAIQARQREGDVATVIYHDNLNASIQEGGDVINQLLPIAYDSMRTVRSVGADDKHELLIINDPEDENSPDITRGKYDVHIETGPSFTSQRQEALDAMMTLIQTSPDLMQVIGDLVAKNMDWPGAYEIAERLKKIVPKELLDPEDQPEQPEGEQPQDPAAMVAQQAQQMQLQDAQAQLEHAQQLRDIELQEARQRLLQAQAQTATAQAKAEQADYEAKRARIETEMAPQAAQHKMDLAERAASAKAAQSATRSAGSRPAGDHRANKGAQKGRKQ